MIHLGKQYNLMIQTSGKVQCFDVFDNTGVSRATYQRLALVTHADHVAAAMSKWSDDKTLLVSSNWLLWQSCVHDGLPCIHTSVGLIDWNADAISRDLFIEANSWIYRDGKDETVFKNISLGRKFTSHSSLALADYSRLSRTLESVCKKFSPKEVHAFGFRTDYGFLGPKWRKYILREITEKIDAELIIHDNYFYSTVPDFPTNVHSEPSGLKRASLKKSLVVATRSLLILALVIAGRIRLFLSTDRSRVISLVSQLTSIPMIKEISSRRLFMLMIAKWFPNKRNLKWMFRSIYDGVLPIGCQKANLSSIDRAELAAIRQTFEQASTSEVGVYAFMAAFGAQELLTIKRLEDIAAKVIWARRLIEAYRPQDVLTDSLLNPISGIFIDVAREMGIPVTVMLHAHYIQNLKFERLGCDPRVGKQADRFFSWGIVNEKWLRKTGATAVPVRTGNPISGKFVSKFRPVKNGQDKVLLMQYTIAYSDLTAWPHHEYEFFVNMLRALNDHGYTNVRMRLHPGVPKNDYYREIADFFGLICEINDSGPFEEHIEWSDFVIGPVISGAMLEVMASGRRYYPVLMQPSAVDKSHLDGLECYFSSEEVTDALVNGTPGKLAETLESFTNISSNPCPAASIWRAIENRTGIENFCREAL